jgi:type IV secretion system protein VirB3/type IV secretion system protein VirB4
MSGQIKSVPIRRSLLRHALVMGGERDLVMTCALFAMLTAMSGMSLAACAAGVTFWIISTFALRRMAKADPQMSKIWLRHMLQQSFYPARSTPWAVEKQRKR